MTDAIDQLRSSLNDMKEGRVKIFSGLKPVMTTREIIYSFAKINPITKREEYDSFENVKWVRQDDALLKKDVLKAIEKLKQFEINTGGIGGVMALARLEKELGL